MRDAVMRCDVAVVGGGPAGVAAACRAAESGADVVLVDEADSLGGQVFRRSAGKPPPARARGWLERFERSGAAHVARATVFDLESDGAEWRLHVDDDPTGRRVVVAERVVLATGARERLLPFPGWTLPG